MKLLDLFCGEGLAAWGYWLSGRFSEIVGIDINPEMKSRYAFDFICGDALRLDYDFLAQFDFIHASPPCQAYSKATLDKSRHLRLVAATHLICQSAGLPHVIENVEGSGRELRPNLVMNGHGLGLPSERRRYFYVSLLSESVRCLGTGQSIRIHGGSASRDDLIRAMGLDMINPRRLLMLTKTGMEQGIPPIFTRTIAEMVLPDKFMIA